MSHFIPSYQRYQRQIILKEFGEAGQLKLFQSNVLVIGAGGLGCPALQYLAAAGVGNIGIVDDDIISESNLHRQVIFSCLDIGLSKAETAKTYLSRLNNEINIVAYNERLTTQNSLSIINNYDIIIDGTDNFATRYLINDACVILNKPLVFGAVSQFTGQVAVFNYQQLNNQITPVNYRDLFPIAPKNNEVLNCADAGVLGVVPGFIGTMQACETIKLITGIGTALIDKLLTYNALNNQLFEVALTAKKITRSLIPATKLEFEKMDYEWLCASQDNKFEIDNASFNELINQPDVTIIDVREPGELPTVTQFNCINIPLSLLHKKISSINNSTIIVFCQSGIRSLHAAQLLSDAFGNTKKVHSLKNGLLNWLKKT